MAKEDVRPREERRSRRGFGRATIADVAALARVAPITVSRALRHPDAVSLELRRRVDEAVAALGYQPDPAARALATSRSDVIGVIVPSLSNIVFSDVLRGIYDELGEAEFQVQIANTHYSPLQEERILRSFAGQRPAAMIVSGIDQTDLSRDLLKQMGCPVVQIMELCNNPVDMIVGFSHSEAGAAATRHLLDAGYKRVGFIGARMDPRSQRRLAGYRRVMEELDQYDPKLVVTSTHHSSVPLGRQLLLEALSQAPTLDAVFCNNDDLALGILFECQQAGLKIPRAFGICGFNDLEFMKAAFPAITSVETYRYRIGQRAAEMLKARLSGRPLESHAEDVGFRLNKRQSSNRHNIW